MRTLWYTAAIGSTLWLHPSELRATMPGPTWVLQCPDSTAVVASATLISGNTLGGIRWSDGTASYPMLPAFPEITRCGDKGRFFWVEDAQLLGKVGFMGDKTHPQSWNTAPMTRFLKEEEYLEALASGAATTSERELRLRLMTWHAANACTRVHSSPAPGPITPQPADDCRTVTFPAGSSARQNLETLARIFAPKNDADRLLQAEMFRELGRFDEASQLLSSPFSEPYPAIVRQLQERIQRRDDRVFIIR